MKKQLLLLATTCLALSSGGAFAQSAYPCAVVKFVSPYPPGGTTDILARMLAPGLAKQLGTNVVVENKGGASSNIGTEFVANSASDGCTLLLGNNTGIVINQNLYKLKINPSK
jgi:tripartite-type tricarboxylate transporter receptor subunit TctC